MATVKITDLDELVAADVVAADQGIIVDASDLAQGVAGSAKRVSLLNLIDRVIDEFVLADLGGGTPTRIPYVGTDGNLTQHDRFRFSIDTDGFPHFVLGPDYTPPAGRYAGFKQPLFLIHGGSATDAIQDILWVVGEGQEDIGFRINGQCHNSTSRQFFVSGNTATGVQDVWPIQDCMIGALSDELPACPVLALGANQGSTVLPNGSDWDVQLLIAGFDRFGLPSFQLVQNGRIGFGAVPAALLDDRITLDNNHYLASQTGDGLATRRVIGQNSADWVTIAPDGQLVVLGATSKVYVQDADTFSILGTLSNTPLYVAIGGSLIGVFDQNKRFGINTLSPEGMVHAVCLNNSIMGMVIDGFSTAQAADLLEFRLGGVIQARISGKGYVGSRKNVAPDDIDLARNEGMWWIDSTDGFRLTWKNGSDDVRTDAFLRAVQLGLPGGVASLGVDGKIPGSQLPALAITNTFVVASQAAMLALVAETGDVAVRSDSNRSYILRGADPTVLADWEELRSPGGGVTSVNGDAGPSVTLTTTQIAEGTNLYHTASRVNTLIAAARGVTLQPWDADLDAAAGIATTGLVERTGAGVWTARTLIAADIPTLAQTQVANLVSDLASKAALGTAQTFTAQQVFLCGATGASPAIFRQTGGTAGTHEVQVAHDGTNGSVQSKTGDINLRGANVNVQTAAGAAGNLTALRLTSSAASVNFSLDGNASAWNLGSGMVLAWGSTTAHNSTKDLSLSRAAARVANLGDGSTGGGTLRSIPLPVAQVTADQNNYAPGTARYYRGSSDATRHITGMVAGQDGEERWWLNTGSNSVVWDHESVSSTAANRFTSETGANVTVPPRARVSLVYDGTTSRWFLFPSKSCT